MGKPPPHLKKLFSGGFPKICRQASCFTCGDAKLQHLRDLQTIVFNRESMQGHGPIVAEPRLPYCGGGGGAPPNYTGARIHKDTNNIFGSFVQL